MVLIVAPDPVTNPNSRLLADKEAIHSDLERIATEIVRDVSQPDDIIVVGIHGKGVWIAEYLKKILADLWKTTILSGTIDVGMHRDDLNEHPLPNLQPTNLPATITGKTVVLVDDVIHSGRTARAALDSLHDFGRPDRVLLSALIDRGDRCLPIAPNYVGRSVDIQQGERVQVTTLENLEGFEVHIKAA